MLKNVDNKRFAWVGSNLNLNLIQPLSYLHETKPQGGLFLSEVLEEDGDRVTTAWSEWCEGANFNCDNTYKVFEVQLDENAKILKLEKASDLENVEVTLNFMNFLCIDWSKTLEGYDGVYVGGTLYNTLAFSVWDIPTLLICNTKIIKGIKELGNAFNNEEISEYGVV